MDDPHIHIKYGDAAHSLFSAGPEMLVHLCSLVLAIPVCAAVAPSGPWDAFNYAPSSKTVTPVSVRTVSGTVQGAEGLVQSSDAQATFIGNSSYVVLDWGKEVRMKLQRNLKWRPTV